MKMLQRLAWLLLGTAALAAAGAVRAEYPERPIKIVVPFPAGGGTDLVARLVGQRLSERLKQPVLVENRAGAGTAIGSQAVAKAPPDGYTLLMNIESLSVLPATQPSLPFDPVKDFDPISRLITSHFVLVVPPSLPVKSFKEFVAYARANQGKLNYGSTSTGGASHLATEQLFKAAGIKLAHIPYAGASAAATALLGEQVQAVLLVGTLAMPYLESGKMRAIAVTGSSRIGALPHVPTLAEEGFAGFETPGWTALFAPRGTPQPVVAKLHAAVSEILERMVSEKEYNKIYIEGLQVPAPNTPAEMAKIVADQTARWKTVVKDTGIKLD
ncbi:MAG TPA: tripartite tricarboxylate transporter substrate binding protein [Ramlibacter sp.]|nr:tripartite tricarboxylate transporter substrate binding protein [Ramlibacter sp.]